MDTPQVTIGHTYILTVKKVSGPGAYLDADALGEILLPHKHCPLGLRAGDHLPVFLYLDSEDRPIATTQKPKVELDEYAYLRAVENTDYGTFMDWGLDKDLLTPFGEQHRPMEAGKSYIVYVYLNRADGRITASSKIDKFLDEHRPHEFKVKQRVNLIIANRTELGYKAIVDHSHWGVLYNNEVKERLSFGQTKQGYVKFVRPDNKIDLALAVPKEARDKSAEVVLGYLRANKNFAAAHDKTDPAVIDEMFGMSKKEFKRTIGGLYKKRIISIETGGIRLLNPK